MNELAANGPTLLCYDGSEEAAGSVARAGVLVGGGRAFVAFSWIGLSRLLLRSDVSGLTGPIAEAAKEVDEADAAEAKRVAAEGAQLARAAGFDPEPLVVEEHDKTWRTILAAAERHSCGLIVLGARGRSGVRGAVLGSVSNAVVHHAPIPTLVVPSGGDRGSAEGPLLLCYDGSENAKRGIELAGQLLAKRPAKVAQVWESWVARAPALAAVSGAVRGMAAELDQIGEEQSGRIAADGVEIASAAGFAAEALCERAGGPIWSSLLDAADDCDAEALVLGSRGLTGISAALGSVSYGVLHHSRRPVLIVPPTPR